MSDATDRYRVLFNSIDEGFCIVQVIFDASGTPADYRFLEVNRVFEQQTGLVNAVGRTARELVPDLEAHWFDAYGRVAATREPERFVRGSDAMRRWFDVYAFPIDEAEERHVAILFKDITATRDSEARLRTLVDQAPVLIWLTDEQNGATFMNAEYVRFLGQPAEALIGGGWIEAVHPDDRTAYYEGFLAATRTRSRFEADVRFRRADGVYRWMRTVGVPRMSEGVYRGYIGSTSDIHERKMAEQAVRESEERFRHMADNAPVMVWVTKPDGQCSYLSKSWYAFTGQTPETGLGFGWLEATHPEDRAAAGRAFLKALDERAPFRVECRLRRWDGQYTWAIDSALPRIGEDGEFLGFIGSVIDIAERKQAEAAMQASEHRARLALAIARLGTWSWDPVRDVVTADSRCREICFLGDRSPLSLKDIVPRVHPDDWPHVEVALQQALVSGGDGTYAVEFRMIDGAGHVHWVSSRGQAMFEDARVGGSRRAVSLLGSVLDITERKQSEAELRLANQMKDEFLATLSHELRTPLNAIVGWTHILRRGRLLPEQRERALESLERNADAQTQLVDDLLDVSRIISGKLQITREPVDLRDVVSASLDTVRPVALGKGVALSMAAAPASDVVVLGDADRLEQIMWNLLTNAVKFTPAGGRVDVALRLQANTAEIEVRDSGEGIASDFLPEVFDRFRQADGSTTRRHGGLGLGLALVRHLTEAHQGTVSAESDGLGHGAVFRLRLPLGSGKTTEALPGARHQRSRTDAGLAGARILVVDDEPDARDLLAAVMEEADARAVTAASAEEALVILGHSDVDVVLADIGMPGRDGYSLLEEIRTLPGRAGLVPVIAVTAYATAADRERALAAGFVRHVAKPIIPASLVTLVGGVLARQ